MSPVSRVRAMRAAQADGRAGAPPASETAADGAAEDGVNVVGSLGSAPGRPAAGVAGVEHFELATSRGARGWEPQLGPAAMETVSEMGAQGSETVSELADRVAAIAEALSENGHSAEEVDLAMKVGYEKNSHCRRLADGARGGCDVFADQGLGGRTVVCGPSPGGVAGES